MLDWMGDNAWAVWFGAAALLAVAELMSMDFVLLMIALGALGGGVSDLAGAPVPVQILVTVAVAMGTLLFLRPSVVRRMHRGGAELTIGHQALVGRQAVVTEEVSGHGGQIHLAGETWTARAFDENQTIPVGTTVDVFEIDGATAVVYPSGVEPLSP